MLLDYTINILLPIKTLFKFFCYFKIKVAILDTNSTFVIYKKNLLNRINTYDII